VSAIWVLGLVGVLVAPGGAGCASPEPVDHWVRDAEAYIGRHAVDANLLRGYAAATSSPDSRPALLRLATLDVVTGLGLTHDVAGVLVGFPAVEGRRWYVFMVATIRVTGNTGLAETAAAIVDVRPVALRVEGGRFVWQRGAADDAATERYVRARVTAPAEQTAHRLFPGRADVFALTVDGSVVSVTERGSGARWTLSVSAE
jgi:hypothetical protein